VVVAEVSSYMLAELLSTGCAGLASWSAATRREVAVAVAAGGGGSPAEAGPPATACHRRHQTRHAATRHPHARTTGGTTCWHHPRPAPPAPRLRLASS
jgi:hypothetical protein